MVVAHVVTVAMAVGDIAAWHAVLRLDALEPSANVLRNVLVLAVVAGQTCVQTTIVIAASAIRKWCKSSIMRFFNAPNRAGRIAVDAAFVPPDRPAGIRSRWAAAQLLTRFTSSARSNAGTGTIVPAARRTAGVARAARQRWLPSVKHARVLVSVYRTVPRP